MPVLDKTIVRVSIVATAATVGVVSLVAAAISLRLTLKHRKLHAAAAAMDKETAEAARKGKNSTVHLLIVPRWRFAPSVSPPCTKLETFLRLAKIPYEAHVVSSTKVSPTGCLPCIIHNGKRMAESNVIIDYITAQFRVKLDKHLTEEQRALGTAVGSMLEYGDRFAYYRTITGEGAKLLIPHVARALRVPQLIARIIVYRMRARLTRSAQLAGIDTSTEESEQEYLQDIKTIEHIIGEKSFLLGDEPTSYDCAVYAAFLPIVHMDVAEKVSKPFAYIKHSKVLTSYVDRMTEATFPDLTKLLEGQ
ncbi:uncharacterized protein TM35_000152270 [Trypanosoma theileri]|uniref:Thioredoxin-like fold domain-containing protein n=1 Tax=Trypanosoma theileri TaxID=67003 RepID=A0A1X0NVR0_9TRYP|nr:uncharacterized protein TM35_000152270 [Trypanosoma theileri]ORC88796.1 hypothetical protein TM35_000152270 [Trypanosoma theileri]